MVAVSGMTLIGPEGSGYPCQRLATAKRSAYPDAPRSIVKDNQRRKTLNAAAKIFRSSARDNGGVSVLPRPHPIGAFEKRHKNLAIAHAKRRDIGVSEAPRLYRSQGVREAEVAQLRSISLNPAKLGGIAISAPLAEAGLCGSPP